MAEPGNRPRGAPREAQPAIIAWYLLIGVTCAEIVEFLPLAAGSEHGAYFMTGWIVASALILVIAIGIGSGKLWAVQLFRWSVYGAAVCYLPILGIAISTFRSDAARQRDPLAPDMAFIVLIFLALELIAYFVLFRAFARVRWLDPRSLPKEWEPPGRPIRSP